MDDTGFDVDLRDRPIEYVATGIVVKDGKMLLVHHKKLKMWLPPGGHIEKNELPSECVVREMKEETGFDVEIVNKPLEKVSSSLPLPVPNWTQLEDIQGTHWHFDFMFLCDIVGGELQKSHESNDVKFLGLDEILALKDTTNDMKLLAKMLLA